MAGGTSPEDAFRTHRPVFACSSRMLRFHVSRYVTFKDWPQTEIA